MRFLMRPTSSRWSTRRGQRVQERSSQGERVEAGIGASIIGERCGAKKNRQACQDLTVKNFGDETRLKVRRWGVMGLRMGCCVHLLGDACENPCIEKPCHRSVVAAVRTGACGGGECGAALSGDGVRYIECAAADWGARDGADSGWVYVGGDRFGAGAAGWV